MKRRIVLVAVCVGIAIAIMLKVGNDNRERNLADLIQFNDQDLLVFGITVDRTSVDESQSYEWYTKEPELVEEVLSFFANYQVKRVESDIYNQQLLQGDQQELMISHHKSNSSAVFWGEQGVHIVGLGPYKVVNGPIDLHWFRDFIKEHESDEL